MEKLQQAIAAIKQPNREITDAALDRLSQQVRPAGSLGILEPIAARLAGIAGSIDVKLKDKIIVTCAGDHGVVEEGVSLFPQEVTPQMVTNFVDGRTSINVLAGHAGARVMVADLGVNFDFEPSLPIFHKKIRKSTSNFAKEPAMSREEAVQAVEAGIEIVDELVAKGPVDMLGTGDMGIGNTTPSSAIIAAFSGMDAEKLTGRGTGIDDAMLKNKIEVINKAIAFHKPDPRDALDVLAKVGGFEIGGLSGLVIGAAKHGIPVVCDGLISTAGALIGCELAPAAKQYLFASHRSVEAGHVFMHQRLDLQPVLDLQFRLGEGTGAALAMELLDAATRILADIKTFAEANIENVQE
ncbi:MAG: nicotinate-nucleotide--dimethylbenzimidazole phosphoribosyltransferase [Proteobacteria bacterium]|nr:nicotinate-nucleotide--dimethylbenzimidazole phosphoribosyltransferase [Pseudomonadota bacterium]